MLLLFVLAGCGSEATKSEETRSAELEQLVAWMCGSFSSATQADADPVAYFDIRLEMVEIRKERNDGPWLYVEQAVAKALERPYRQRVYHLCELRDGVFESRIFAFSDPQSRVPGGRRSRCLISRGRTWSGRTAAA